MIKKFLNYNPYPIKKLFLAYSLVSSILFLAVLLWLMGKTYSSFMEIKKLEMEYAASQIEIGFNDAIVYGESVISHIGQQIALSGGSNQEIKEILNYFSETNVGGSDLIKDTLSISMFSWANTKNFITINSEYKTIRFPYDVSNRKYVHQAMADPWSMKVGSLTIGSQSGQKIMPSAMAIKSLRNGRLMGAIMLGFSTDRITYKLNQILKNPFLDFAVIDKKGEVVLESTPGIFSEDAVFHKNFDAIEINKNGVISQFSALFPSESFLIIKANERNPYTTIVGYQNSLIIEGLVSALWPYILGLLGLLLIFFNTWSLLKLKIISPLEKLSKVSKMIARDGEYEVEMPKSNISEIVELTKQVKLIERYKINLLQAKKSQERFFANMSHELRTPLNGILNFSYMIKNEMFGALDSNYKEMAGDIHQSGSHLLNLVNDILDFSKMDIGKIKLSEENFDIAEEARAAIKITLSDSEIYNEESKIRAICNINIGDNLFYGDRRMIKQILLNLLSNASKFTDEGSITLEIFITHQKQLILEIKDTGIGIKKEDLEKLAVEFGQVGNGYFRGKKQGSGLGLFLVKKMTELHQGTFEISSIYGQGTNVRIAFPKERIIAKKEIKNDPR